MVVFPDKGDYSEWQETLQAVPNLHYHISDVMEKVQGDCHTIAQMVLSQQPLRPTETESALMRMEDANPNIALLVKSLGLEVVGILPTSDIPKDETPKTEPVSKEPKEDAVMQSILLAQENEGMEGIQNATSASSRTRVSTAPIVASSIDMWSMGKATAA